MADMNQQMFVHPTAGGPPAPWPSASTAIGFVESYASRVPWWIWAILGYVAAKGVFSGFVSRLFKAA